MENFVNFFMILEPPFVSKKQVDVKVRYILAGVIGDCAEFVGITDIELGICSDVVNARYQFVVFDDNILATCDGLLRKDFLKNNGAQVFYALDHLCIWRRLVPLEPNDTMVGCDLVENPRGQSSEKSGEPRDKSTKNIKAS